MDTAFTVPIFIYIRFSTHLQKYNNLFSYRNKLYVTTHEPYENLVFPDV